MRARVLVFAFVTALVFALPAPKRAPAATWAPATWSERLDSAPRALATDRTGAIVTGDDDSVVSFSPRGAQQWRTHLDDVGHGTPALSKRTVLVGMNGRVVALSRHDGAIRWQMATQGEVTSLALAGRYALVGDDLGNLFALGAASGGVLWSVHHDGEVSAAARVDLPSVTVVAVWHELPAPAVRGFDLTNGALRWEWPVGIYATGPGLHHGRAFMASADVDERGWVVDLDPATGAGRWTVQLSGWFLSSIVPAVDAHDLVLVDVDGLVFDIDPVSGAPRWSTELGRYVDEPRIVLLRHRVVLTAILGEMFVLDRASGRIVAHGDEHSAGGLPIVAAPFRGDDSIVVARRLAAPDTLELRRVP